MLIDGSFCCLFFLFVHFLSLYIYGFATDHDCIYGSLDRHDQMLFFLFFFT